MSTVTVDQALQIAQTHLATGQWAEAENLCQQILATFPEQAGALHLLAGVAISAGRADLAPDLLRRSIAADPVDPEIHVHLAEVLNSLGRAEEAAASYQQAATLQPRDVDTLNNLGMVWLKLARQADAKACFERALAVKPDFAPAHNNLGTIAQQAGQPDEARAHFERAIACDGRFALAYRNLAKIFLARNQSQEALPALERALALEPDDTDLLNDFGSACANLRRYEEARVHFVRAVELDPNHYRVINNLGQVFTKLGRSREAREHLERALALQPGYASAYFNLGMLHIRIGQIERGMEYARMAVAADPSSVMYDSTLVLGTYYHSQLGKTEVGEALRGWNARHSAPLRGIRRPHDNDRDPERRLKVGYVSADFYFHAASHFTVPLLEAHDPAQVETHVYASVRVPDPVTDRLRRAAHVWHDALPLGDEELAEQVRADGIDILVDLSLHTDGCRLLAFAYKPAPVQVSWLGFAGSTGLEAMDYRLTDKWIDPVGADESWSSETPVRLPDGWCCYEPLIDTPAVATLPALRNGYVTFGSLNNFAKINAPTLRRWARALRAVERSRLLMHAVENEAQAFALGTLAEEGIAAERVEFVGKQSLKDYCRTYGKIDVGLDPFPFNGMTTTCEALWMGVPVLSLPGELPASRTGLSLMSVVGLEGWVARDEAEYERKARELTGNLTKLQRLRAGLRRRMQESALTDAPRFARNVESAYRQMWRTWVAGEAR